MEKSSEWPFQEPRNCTTITVWRVLDGKEPITLVSHDVDGWQFLNTKGGAAPDFNDAAVVALSTIAERDPSVLELADMPIGWKAYRQSAKHEWMLAEPAPAAKRKKKIAKKAKKKAAKKKTAKKAKTRRRPKR